MQDKISNTVIIAKLTWGAVLMMFEFFMNPSFSLFGVVLAVIFLDFITGVVKSVFKKVARTSEGYRKTVIKLLQYIIPVFIFWGAGRYIPEYKEKLEQASGFVMMFIVYIEVTSIFENLYAIDSKSVIAKNFYRPVLVLLKFGIENNPVSEFADKIKSKAVEKIDISEFPDTSAIPKTDTKG